MSSAVESFIQLADAIVGNTDPTEFLQQVTVTAAAVFGTAVAGVLLGDERGALRVAAASTEQTLELLQSQADEGPSPDCMLTGQPIAVTDLATCAERWPDFAAQARTSGLAWALAVPMRLRTERVGALTVYGTEPVIIDAAAVRLGQALADMATIGLLQARTTCPRETIVEQLQKTINDRVIVEQAKGVIAERLGLDMDRSFALLRGSASKEGRRLPDLARAVVDGTEAVS